MIEVVYYEINFPSYSLSEQVYVEKPTSEETFWNDVTKYTASANVDESFVSEIAYVMVTLHRTGA
ncbi:MAG: hypothetical protein COW26_03195 [Nitrosopumilales archaeon CG15_BIG_FIL_POST_REV_8_21_14_020_33_23]|nr:MAG: hypothetical protein COW26_03195 [Nitrosopumilales archaeon CG15_BIG_FIL_POST_REV_8_21_14_020_33_23]PIY89848.1 MAG: hypothetical protein COY74_04635 [Nitrosopumilales archaeon CG_4_10_14_0_8_um_filter_34_8]PJB96980.1 MAG: hypothetical protein CO079_08580 [Nitrosopumilales archaeon CG_4_9_14_0_8_um_filter_34_10]